MVLLRCCVALYGGVSRVCVFVIPSHPVKPVATAPGAGGGTTATRKPTRAPRATRPDEEGRTNAGPRGTPERHAAGHNHGTRTGAKPQRPPGAANPGSAQKTRRPAAQDKVPMTAGPPHPHTAPTASGKRAPAACPKGGQSGSGERPTPDAPHPGRRRPPRATSCRPHSAQSQLARARAVGLETGPHARTPPHPQPVGSGPRKPAQRAGSRGWESA